MKLARLQAAYLPGYNAAVGSSIRQGPVGGQQSSFQLLHQSNKSILMIYVRLQSYLLLRTSSYHLAFRALLTTQYRHEVLPP